MKQINSRANELVKHVASLHQKKYRDLHGQYIAEGLRTCQTLIQSGASLLHLFVTPDLEKDARAIAPDHTIVIVSQQVMLKLSGAQSPSGIVAQCTKPVSPSLKNLKSGIVLTQVMDPGNMGTLIRSAAAFGYTSVVCIEGTDPYSPKAIHASAGTLQAVSIFECSWTELRAQANDIDCIALVVSGGVKPEAIPHKPALLVIGSEAHGIPEAWINECDQRLTLPMPGNTESLNAAVAGSIGLYILRDRIT